MDDEFPDEPINSDLDPTDREYFRKLLPRLRQGVSVDNEGVFRALATLEEEIARVSFQFAEHRHADDGTLVVL